VDCFPFVIAISILPNKNFWIVNSSDLIKKSTSLKNGADFGMRKYGVPDPEERSRSFIFDPG
jgi:hypothetical protein